MSYTDLGRDLDQMVRANAIENLKLVIQQTNDVRYIRDVRRNEAEYYNHKSLVLWDMYALKTERNLPFVNALKVAALEVAEQSEQEYEIVRIELDETREERFTTLFPGAAARGRVDSELGAEVYRLSLLIASPIKENAYGKWATLSEDQKTERTEYMQVVYNMGLMVESLIQRQVDFNTSTNVTRIVTPVAASYFPGTPNGNPYIRKDISISFQPKRPSRMMYDT